MSTKNIYQPFKAQVSSVTEVSRDVKLFRLDVPEDFVYRPGQFVMASVFGAGEIPISITSTPGKSATLDLCIRTVGVVSAALNSLATGHSMWVRGPYGKPFPVKNGTKDTLVIAGGIGIVPLRPLIDEILDHHAGGADGGRVTIIYGSRNPLEVLFTNEAASWKERGAETIMTVDACDLNNWQGCLGLVTEHIDRSGVDFKNATAYLCGPWAMIQAAMRDLSLMGMPDERIITSLEAHMKCGVGKCGHCYCGGKLLCEEGPVFSLAEIRKYHIRPGVDSPA